MQPIMSYAVIAVLAFGVLAAFPRLFNLKGYLKTPGLAFTVLFAISFAISAVFNIKYGYADNFKGFIWMCLHFFTLFACDVDRDEKEYKKEFHILSIFFMMVMLVMSTASLVQFFINYSFEQYNPDYTRLAGLVWGRLWGVFRDPNYASVFASISVVMSLYYFKKYKSVVGRILLILNMFIQLAYIGFSDSRTGLVTLFLTVFVYVFMLAAKKSNIKNILKYVVSVVLAIVIAGAFMMIPPVLEHVGDDIVIQYYESIDDPEVEVPELEGDRDEQIENDVSNRRFDLWKSGVEIFATKPIVGVSFYNLQNYALQELPETYLVNNDHGQFNNMHNMLFNLLSGQGCIGMILFIAFALYVIVYILKRIFNVEEGDYEYLVIMLACIVAAFSSSMFLTDVIYVNSPTSIIFWLFLGYMLHYFKRKDMNKKV